ncbi:nuclear mRNA export, poly(A)+RNA binding protein [Mortierella sp. 14UC]|nr:nuclear mRNA export, poly(A)+RNA binding protein [Mortierella sp. 14UC]
MRGGNNNPQVQGQNQGALIVFISRKKGQGGEQVLNDPDLLDFLSQRVLPTVINVTSLRYYDYKDQVSFIVGDIEEAKVLRNLSGIRFKSHKLLITTSVDGALNGQNGTVAGQIRTVNGQTGQPQDNTQHSPAATEVVRNSFSRASEVITISLSFNGLMSLQSISALNEYFPDLRHLSLKGNNIPSLDELLYIGGGGQLSLLEELVLKDNPVYDKASRTSECADSYKSILTDLFPNLSKLDDDIIPKEMKFCPEVTMEDLNVAKVALPAPVRGNYFDSEETKAAILEFLTRRGFLPLRTMPESDYFKEFDRNREALRDVYDTNAMLSFTAIQGKASLQNNGKRSKSGGKGSQSGGQGSQSGEYIPRSRNLLNFKNQKKPVPSLFRGNKEILQSALSKPPKTRHDLSDDSKICVDAYRLQEPLPVAYFTVAIHGEFEEFKRGSLTDSVRKSFDRIFILVDAPFTYAAAEMGWKCLILSDHLTIREYNGFDAWKPEPLVNMDPSLAAAFDSASSAIVPRHAESISGKQHTIAQELMRQTGLTYHNAVQALLLNKWNPDDALAYITSIASSLQPTPGTMVDCLVLEP